MDPLDRDVFLLNVVFAALCGFLIFVPILYIYVRRKTAKPQTKTSPAVPTSANLAEPTPPEIEAQPAKTPGRNLPKPRQVTPEQRLRASYQATFVVALFALAGGLAPLLLSNIPQTSYAYTADMLPTNLRLTIVGMLLLVLGFLIKRRSLAAVIVAIVVFALNWLVDFFISVSNSMPTGILFCNGLYLLFIVAMIYGGIRGIRELKQADLNHSEKP
jgi:hypothetical protein